MGCLRRIGLFAIVVALGAAAWLTRDVWLPRFRSGGEAHAPIPVVAAVTWELLTPEGATRAKQAIQRLAARSGPVFANIDAGDLTAYIFDELSHQLPPSAQGTAAAVIGDRLYVRAMVKPAEFGANKVPGALQDMLGEREPLEFGGTLDVVRPGLAEYRVLALKIRDLSIPSAAIPKLLREIERDARPAVIAADAMPLVVPMHIGDVRVHNGHITLYKAGS